MRRQWTDLGLKWRELGGGDEHGRRHPHSHQAERDEYGDGGCGCGAGEVGGLRRTPDIEPRVAERHIDRSVGPMLTSHPTPEQQEEVSGLHSRGRQ